MSLRLFGPNGRIVLGSSDSSSIRLQEQGTSLQVARGQQRLLTVTDQEAGGVVHAAARPGDTPHDSGPDVDAPADHSSAGAPTLDASSICDFDLPAHTQAIACSLYVQNELFVGGGIVACGDIITYSNLSVSGSLNVADTIHTDGLSVAGSCDVQGALIVNGGLSAAGLAFLDTLSIAGSLQVAGEVHARILSVSGVAHVPYPHADSHAATKQYVDDQVSGLRPRGNVHLASSAKWSMWAADAAGLGYHSIQVVPRASAVIDVYILGAQTGLRVDDGDGVLHIQTTDVLSEGSAATRRILWKNFPDEKLNGVYYVHQYVPDATYAGVTYTAMYRMRRSSDCDNPSSATDSEGDIQFGDFFFVEQGAQANAGFALFTKSPRFDAIYGTDIRFLQFTKVQLAASAPIVAHVNDVSLQYNSQHLTVTTDGMLALQPVALDLLPGGGQITCTGANGIEVTPASVDVGSTMHVSIAPDATINVHTLVAAGNIQCQNIIQTSDARMKVLDHARDARCLQQLRELNPIWYRFKPQYAQADERPRLGLLAHEVAQTFAFATGELGNGMQGVDYASLVGVLVSSVKELADRVDALEATGVSAA